MRHDSEAPSPIQPKLLSRLNERQVLRVIQQHGPSTRAEMTKHIGVTFPTAAKAVAALLESRLLEEYEEAGAGRGRPAKRLRLASETAQVLGVSRDVDSCSVAASGFDGVLRPATLERFATAASYDELLDRLAGTLKDRTRSKTIATHGIGISLPGLIDSGTQQVVFSANLPLLNGRALGQDLTRATGVECVMMRDSHALCLSERLHGGAKHLDNFVMIDLCTGVGMGVMVNGQFITGQNGFAGEIGHSPVVANGKRCHCGNRGCLETVASQWALLERVSQRLGYAASMDDVVGLVRQGNAVAKTELRRLCKFLALGLSHAINTFNPGQVFVYGRVFEDFPELLDLLIKQTRRTSLRPAFANCEISRAGTTPLEGAIASIISYLTDARVPEIDATWSMAPMTGI
jgi:predicted NBD/HSP70 family sugar kinase